MNVLFMHRGFYEYDLFMKSMLEKNGCNVFEFNLKVKYADFFHFDILRELCRRKSIRRKDIVYSMSVYSQDRMLKKLVDERIQIDVVFVLAGQSLRKNTLMRLKNIYPNARFIWYIWDNIKFLREYEDNKKYFNELITFDFFEAKKEKINYLPTFYIKQLKLNKVYDFCFIGKAHSNRILLLHKILNKLKNRKFFLFLKVGFYELIYVLFRPKLWHLLKFMHYKGMSYEKNLEIMAKSRVIIDIPIKGQTGPTLRVFEAMGVHSKLITTNNYVKELDIFSPNRINFFDENNFTFDEKWIIEKYEEPDKDKEKKYSIENFAFELVNRYFRSK